MEEIRISAACTMERHGTGLFIQNSMTHDFVNIVASPIILNQLELNLGLGVSEPVLRKLLDMTSTSNAFDLLVEGNFLE